MSPHHDDPVVCVKVVGESGLFTPDDIAYVQAAGVKAVNSHTSIKKCFGCVKILQALIR